MNGGSVLEKQLSAAPECASHRVQVPFVPQAREDAPGAAATHPALLCPEEQSCHCEHRGGGTTRWSPTQHEMPVLTWEAVRLILTHTIWKAGRKKSAGRMAPTPALPVPKGVASSGDHLAGECAGLGRRHGGGHLSMDQESSPEPRNGAGCWGQTGTVQKPANCFLKERARKKHRR